MAFVQSLSTCFANDQLDNQSQLQKIAHYVFIAVGVLAIIFGNYTRFKYLANYFKLQVRAHRILPRAYRNQQLAWSCNLWAAAVSLESVSLSDYLVSIGSTILPGKEKDITEDMLDAQVKVESISGDILR